MPWSETLEVPADGRWHAFELKGTDRTWKLQALLRPFQTTTLELRLDGGPGGIPASTVLSPALVTGNARRQLQYLPPHRYDSPFNVEISMFEPGKRMAFRLEEPRLAYSLPPRRVSELYAGFSMDGIPREALDDPVLAVSGTDGRALTWANGRFELERYYITREGKTVSGYFVADDRNRALERLLVAEIRGGNAPGGRLFHKDLLVLYGPEGRPAFFHLCARGAVPVDIPWNELRRKCGVDCRLQIVDGRYLALGRPVLALSILARPLPDMEERRTVRCRPAAGTASCAKKSFPSLSDADRSKQVRLLRFHVRNGRAVLVRSKALAPRETSLLLR